MKLSDSLTRAGASEAAPDIQPLSIEQCWLYLRSQQLGRVTITAAARPHVFPVNFAIAGRTIVFRTAPGTKLSHGPGSVACFEVDDYDRSTLEGWSVMAFGVLRDITLGVDRLSQRLRQLPVQPAAPGTKLHWIAMRAEEVTGRHFRGGWIVPATLFGQELWTAAAGR